MAVVAFGVAGMLFVPSAGAVTRHAQTEAKDDLLRLSDLPKGWKMTGAPHPSTTKTTSEFSKLGSCEGISLKGIDNNPPNEGEDFTAQGGTENVVESVAVFPSAGVAGRAYTVFSNAKAESCIAPTLIQSLASTPSAKGTTAKATTARLVLPTLSAAASGFVVHVPLTSSGQTVTVVGDFITMRSGNAIAVLSPIYAATTLTTTFVRSLAKKAASRLR